MMQPSLFDRTTTGLFLNLGLNNVSHETYEKLLIYYELLCKWQERMNLVSRKSLSDAFSRHFLDSAQLHKFCCKTEGNILDFGTGAGFPGLVLAIMGLKRIHLID